MLKNICIKSDVTHQLVSYCFNRSFIGSIAHKQFDFHLYSYPWTDATIVSSSKKGEKSLDG